MRGRRYIDVEDPTQSHEHMQPGGYRREGGVWYATTPNGLYGNLSAHDVTEHSDGTITVSPSILVEQPSRLREAWHGYLERGVWREA